jgi:hypothetical protein
MITENLTEAQEKAILFHFRAAALCLARKWDHVRTIELILNQEIHDFKVEFFASWVGNSGPDVSPNDLKSIKWDDVKKILNANAQE